jgi:hypothetical protein
MGSVRSQPWGRTMGGIMGDHGSCRLSAAGSEQHPAFPQPSPPMLPFPAFPVFPHPGYPAREPSHPCWLPTFPVVRGSHIPQIIVRLRRSGWIVWLRLPEPMGVLEATVLLGSYYLTGSFAHHFQIKLSIRGSNRNSIFVIMSELEFFLLTRVLTQNFNTMDLVKFLEKNQKIHV